MVELSPFGLGLVLVSAAYALLVVGLVRLRLLTMVDAGNPVAVYRKLERVHGRVYPETRGDTLKALLVRARKSYPSFDWVRLDSEFGEYEAYRYGGRPQPAKVEETLKLANFIGKRKH